MANNNQNAIVNPTLKQQQTLKMIIYYFKDKRNGKGYVGQTKRSLRKRYAGKSHTTYFENTFKKYGWENFEITILKYSLQTFEEMDYWENHYIKEYNTLAPNGYNLVAGGCYNRNRSQEAKERARRNSKFKKRFKLKNFKTGEIIEVNGIEEFSRNSGISSRAISSVLSKKIKYAYEWCLPETEINPHYLKNHFSNEIVSFYNISEFCRENDCNINSILRVLDKNINYHKYWTLPESNYVPTFQPSKFYTVKSPQGAIFMFDDVYTFSKKHNFKKEEITHLLKGRHATCQGWTLAEYKRRECWLKNLKTNKIYYVSEGILVKNFTKEHKIQYYGLNLLMQGKIKIFKGWERTDPPIDYQI
jgi:hypothetical protein